MLHVERMCEWPALWSSPQPTLGQSAHAGGEREGGAASSTTREPPVHWSQPSSAGLFSALSLALDMGAAHGRFIGGLLV